MEEIILANGKPTSLKKAVLFRLILAFAIFASVSFYYAFDINGCQRHSVYVGEIHLAQYDTTLPGHTQINKVDFIGFLVSALVFEVEITKSVFIPLLVYESITHLDKMNKILAEGGSDKKWTAEEYVRDQFEKAMKETMLRAEDKVVK
ncbi:hypothetical protein [Intestinimonas butyriciproducens]|uniref:hypothetical protein n=1 Tax=Intestinimonas butyriciproducens TaxID=1297617 RepID=UPI001956A152|nr:hypothetical protein [Intestinimonas butyriciproducens]MBM6919141.1 hypothetical protein [Intestinimonas butyriciproducens]